MSWEGSLARCWIIRWNQKMHSPSDCSLTVSWLKLMRVQTKYMELESPLDKTCFGKNTSLIYSQLHFIFIRPLTLKAEIIVYKTQRQCWVGGSRHQLLASHGSVSLNRRISLIQEQEHWKNLVNFQCTIDWSHVKHLMIVENLERS